MDHLLEIARELLPELRKPGARQAARSRDALTRLATRLGEELATVYDQRRRLEQQLAGADPVPEEPSEPPETARAAPDVLAAVVLADVLARHPTLIPQALSEARRDTFYPLFLSYLLDRCHEVLTRRRLSFWKNFTAGEYVALMEERAESVAKLLVDTDSWRLVSPPPAGSSASKQPPPESPGMSASMLGTADIGTRAAQLKEQCVQALNTIGPRLGFGREEWRRVPALLQAGGDAARTFVTALRTELLIKPELVRQLSTAATVAVPFTTALEAELREIELSRPRRLVHTEAPASVHPVRRAADMNLVGLAFSGGGVRSATFNLGVLQGLAHFGLLKRIDYLSTVSGGGYIGAWLMSWSKRVRDYSRSMFQPVPADRGVATVEGRLRTEPLSEPDALTVRAVRFLREYSNYLTPEAGVFTADTWTMIAIWLRNTMLNQAVLVLTLCSMLCLPWLLWYLQSMLTLRTSGLSATPAGCGASVFATSPVVFTAATASLLYASAVAGHQLRRFGVRIVDRNRTRPEMLTQGGVLAIVVVPAILSAGLLSVALYNAFRCSWTREFSVTSLQELGVVFAVSMLVVAFGGNYGRCFLTERVSTRMTLKVFLSAARRSTAIVGIATVVASAGGAAALVGIGRFLAGVSARSPQGPGGLADDVVVLGVPVVVAVFSVMLVLKIGILGRNLFDDHREWWSRLGAWLNIVSLAWLIVCALSLYSARLIEASFDRLDRAGLSAAAVLWAAWTGAGVMLGKRETNPASGASPLSGRIREWVVRAAPYAFAFGLLILLSVVTFEALTTMAPRELVPRHLGSDAAWRVPNRYWILALPAALAAAAVLLSFRVDINEFSMHHFYKNRLVRCYLGASREQGRSKPERTPDAFTGFDVDDDLKLAFLRLAPREVGAAIEQSNRKEVVSYVGPVPIVNTALNLVKGDDLAWQERKAQSFAFTPFYSGYDYRQGGAVGARQAPYGFRQTALYGYPPFGVALGTAVAISGAAASPNMGYHSSPPAAFLMTMFNARLGWWMGNPRDEQTWLRSGPRRGLLYLLKELFGLTNDRTEFVNLSDGGHFENLGIYELVRRRCRYIIACDAEQDPAMTFNGLGNAIRKCRTDLGAEISISASRIRPAEGQTVSPLHCVLGDITYADGEKGTLLYLKASVTGDEPADVTEYAAREASFPHHSTMSDQFFDESQFESYRKLGFHITHTAFATPLRSMPPAPGLATDEGLAMLFARMRDYWHPADPGREARRTGHAAHYETLLDKVLRDPTLGFLDDAFFTPPPGANRPHVFVGALMLDLMQRVYLDLDLDHDRDHPHNAGWISIFRRWKHHEAVAAAWNASRHDFSRRFQWFYETL